MPDEGGGEDDQRGDHEPASLVQRRPRDSQKRREGGHKHGGPEEDVQSERLAAEEEIAEKPK